MMRRRRSTRSVLKLLAAAAVTTASIVYLLPLSTPPPLALCEDIEEIDTKVLTKPPKRGNAPELLMDFLRTYINEHRPGDEDDDDDDVDEKEPGAVAASLLDTYAGRWYSRDAGGTFVLAFTDDPRPHLEAIRRRRPPETGDWPVDVVRAPHTDSELKAAQKKVSKMFKQLRGRPNLKNHAYASDPQRSRVEISFDTPGYTFEDMAAMTNALDDEAHGKVCLEERPRDGSIRLPTLEDRLKVRFAPMADAVDADSKPVVVWLGRGREGLRLALPTGLRTVEMRLDRRNPPDPESTTLHLLVRQRGCGSGRSGVERMLKPEVIESATEIRIAMGVIPPNGAVACPGHPSDPIKIELAAPIGRRKIVDGLILPPEPLK